MYINPPLKTYLVVVFFLLVEIGNGLSPNLPSHCNIGDRDQWWTS